MEGEHKGYRGGSELFVCFTSRQTSVRLGGGGGGGGGGASGSKSVVSPSRSDKFRDSSSRRGRSKGQSSPMFPNLPYNLTGRKKNGNFETQEPSSPKVTCIGQVRVKSKQNKTLHNVLKSPQREDCMPHRSHQKWVHLFGFGKEVSFNICEALRSFGAEFNCFVPCGSSATATATATASTTAAASGAAASNTPSSKDNKTTTSCGAVFAKWFMVLQDGDEKKTAAQESQQTIAEEEIANICSRPSIQELGRTSIKEVSRPTIKDFSRVSISEDEDEEVVSVCPPKNALLLMRCRSDPLRMSPLDNERGCKSEPMRISCTIRDSGDEDEYEDEYEYDDGDDDEDEDEDEDEGQGQVYKTDFDKAEQQPTYSPEALEVNRCSEEGEDIEKEIQAVMAVANAFLEEGGQQIEEVSETGPQPQPEAEESCDTELDTQTGIAETIPDALLLMMSEPKLSLEISKETWVSREDFVNTRRPVHLVKMDGDDGNSDDDKENEQSREVCNVEEASNHSMSRMKDQNVGPCETSFVLPRCKSEPLRASVKLVPEACFWKPRNLEIPSFIIRGPLEIGAHQA